jgi:dTDP-glucose 4,6-dehydratase
MEEKGKQVMCRINTLGQDNVQRGKIMKIMVTGGAGFIGANFIYYELRKHSEDQIICYDALTYAGNIATLNAAREHSQFSFVRGDIADRSSVYEFFSREHPDIVVNFAAESHVDRSIETPEIFLQTNIIGTSILLDACRKYGIKRYHQVSTDEVYGDLPLDRSDLLFTEETPLHTSSPYSSSKASADLLVQAYARTYGLPVTISRCSNNYGAFQFPEKLIPLMVIRAMRGEKLPVYGDGKNVRDWLHVDDHCAAIDIILRHGADGEVYNVGGHNERSNIDVVRTILALLGRGEEQISFVVDRKGHDRRYAIDPTKIGRELGWHPVMCFDEGIQRTITWYQDHEAWWADILSGAYEKRNAAE